jgi:probable HAF family extracellular repeat protein
MKDPVTTPGRASRRPPDRRRRGRLPRVEVLEARSLLSVTYNAPIDLGTLGGASSWATALNGNGQVVGTSDTGAFDQYGDPVDHAFVWDSTHGMRDLGTYNNDLNSFSSGINASGVVAGASSTAPVQKTDKQGDVYYISTDHAVTWGANFSVNRLGGDGVACGINDAGEVVGTSKGNAILWDGGKAINLGTLGGSGPPSAAIGINAGGQVAGYAPISDSYQTQHAFLWSPNSTDGTNGKMKDLGTLDPSPGYPGVGAAVNAIGEVAGWSASIDAGGLQLAFLYSGGTMYELGTLTAVGGDHTPSEAYGINDGGTVVGYAGSPNGPLSASNRAWIWVPTSPDGTSSQSGLTDLNSLIPAGSGWVLNAAEAVNNVGQIVGAGTINGQLHAFLLNPTSTTALARSTALMMTASAPSPVHPIAAVPVASVRLSVVAPEGSGLGGRSGPTPAADRTAAPPVLQSIFDFALTDLAARPRPKSPVNDRTARPMWADPGLS